MLFIELTGLSGAGKTTIAQLTKNKISNLGFKIEVIDSDDFREHLCRDLSFSEKDRIENIKRLGIVSNNLVSNGTIVIMAAINPFQESRSELKKYGSHVKLVWIDCELEVLIARDTKGLYKRAMLPDNDSQKLSNLSGINHPFEIPEKPDLRIDTSNEIEEVSAKKLFDFILSELNDLYGIYRN